jgi:hypothetical protein
MPYRDLPMMPKPFFMYALLPAMLAAGIIDSPHTWIIYSVFWIPNTLSYAAGVLLLHAFFYMLWQAFQRDI